MKKLNQLIPVHKPEEGLYGDCWRASIACLLEVPAEEVPHPYRDGFVSDKQANEILNDYLLQHNLRTVDIPFNGNPEELGGNSLMGVYWLLLGQSSTGKHSHYVIMHGNERVHSTNDATVIGPDLESGYYWCTLLVHHKG